MINEGEKFILFFIFHDNVKEIPSNSLFGILQSVRTKQWSVNLLRLANIYLFLESFISYGDRERINFMFE